MVEIVNEFKQGAIIEFQAGHIAAADDETSGANTFLELTDSPDSYSGQSLKSVRVKVTEDGLEFFTGGGAVPSGTVIYCGEWDLSLDVVPQTGGTGTAGAIEKGNQFYVEVGAFSLTGPDGGLVVAGIMAQAKVDVPGISLSDTDKWILSYTIR